MILDDVIGWFQCWRVILSLSTQSARHNNTSCLYCVNSKTAYIAHSWHQYQILEVLQYWDIKYFAKKIEKNQYWMSLDFTLSCHFLYICACTIHRTNYSNESYCVIWSKKSECERKRFNVGRIWLRLARTPLHITPSAFPGNLQFSLPPTSHISNTNAKEVSLITPSTCRGNYVLYLCSFKSTHLFECAGIC